ncbi:hypothetical protein B7494_g5656 [Chlorociboria aeruginascens]|nr:hypothetical protein B7494_g5656 [Chlorociboria aeruginascens]
MGYPSTSTSTVMATRDVVEEETSDSKIPEQDNLSPYILAWINIWLDQTLQYVSTWQDSDPDLDLEQARKRQRPNPSPIPVRLLTHNIRYATTSPFPGEKPWSIRHPLLSSQLNFTTSNPTSIICLQEVLHSQLLDIQSSLNSSSPTPGSGWSYVGVGRDDGEESGEYAPIFFRPSVWKLIEWKTVWLSESPDRPGKGWDASSVRIVTVAILESRPRRARAARMTGSGSLTTNHPAPKSTSAGFSLDLPTVLAPDSSKDIEELHDHHKGIFGDEDPDLIPPEASDSGSKPYPIKPSIILRRKLQLEEAEQLLRSFRRKASFFPFVDIAENATVQSLSRTSPFLLLAILTVAAIGDPQLHHQIDEEFRRVLSMKVIVEGKKSLDFLQGILVYVAWYPMMTKPKNNQAFMYMNLSTSLSVDLELNQEYPSTNGFNSISTEGLIQNGSFTIAAKTAYLGCYYLSSCLSMTFRKPQNIHYPTLMNTHGPSFSHSPEIIFLSKLQHLSERIHDAWSYKTPVVFDYEMNTEMNTQVFQNEILELKRCIPEAILNLPIAIRFTQMTIYGHSLGLLRRPYRMHNLSMATHPPNHTHLTHCLEVCKSFFDYLLSLPVSMYTSFTMVQWSSLVHAVLVMSRLTFLMAAQMGWDSDTTRNMVPLVVYLDCLCYRFQDLSSPSSPSHSPSSSSNTKQADILLVFKKILQSVKRSYERRVHGIMKDSFAEDFGNAAGVARGHCPMLDPSLKSYLLDDEVSGWDMSGDLGGELGSMETLDAEFGMGMGLGSGLEDDGNGLGMYHDIWATMTCNWAQEF